MKNPKHAIFVRYGKFEAFVVGPLAVTIIIAVVTALVTQPTLWKALIGL